MIVSYTQAQIDEMQAAESSFVVDTNALPSKYAMLGSKSAKIRAMFEDGYKQSRIAVILGIRPQFVSNVVNRPTKK